MIDDRPRYWHVSGWLAVLLAPVAIPVTIVLALLPGRKTADRTAQHVVFYLREFLEGNGGDWDWDDFTSVSITDPKLDAIRDEADSLRLPLTDYGRQKLQELLERAEALL